MSAVLLREGKDSSVSEASLREAKEFTRLSGLLHKAKLSTACMIPSNLERRLGKRLLD